MKEGKRILRSNAAGEENPVERRTAMTDSIIRKDIFSLSSEASEREREREREGFAD